MVTADDTTQRFPIAPAVVRYIKLGTNNAWFDSCRRHDRLAFGHRAIPHETAMLKDRAAIAAAYLADGRTPSKASDYAREILDFYTLGPDCLWVTFAEGSLWWAFAEPEVHPLDPAEDAGVRYRRVLKPWSNLDAHGNPLSFGTLSTRLTKVAAYRQTLCGVEAEDYLIRRINGEDEPGVAAMRVVQAQLIEATEQLIGALHWRDFEILCDLILTRSGWQRVSELGGLQKDTDLVVEQIATGERAFVQIKSAADQKVFSDYVQRFEADPAYQRMFFVCHTPRSPFSASPTKPVHVWAGDSIARQAINAGLVDWLVEKAG